MRINTEGRFDYRTGLYDDVRALLGEKTQSGAIDASCEFTLGRELFPSNSIQTDTYAIRLFGTFKLLTNHLRS